MDITDIKSIMDVLRIILCGLGIFVLGWGVFDMFDGGGQQQSIGIKKIIGGAAVAIIFWLVMTSLSDSISDAASKTSSLNLMPQVTAEVRVDSAIGVDNIV